MDRAAVLVAEVQVLGTLCNQAGTSEQRAEVVCALNQYAFLEPEHQIVFESIRSLLSADRLSSARLAVHLNNRGFPDVDLERYYAAALANIDDALQLVRQLCSLAHGSETQLRHDRQGKVERDS
jgi:replicative DNA helicase